MTDARSQNGAENAKHQLISIFGWSFSVSRKVQSGKGKVSNSPNAHGELGRHVLIWPFAFGAILILVATAFEHVEWSRFSRVEPSDVFRWSYIIHWLSEIGFAFIIAGIVSATIERGARIEHEKSVSLARQQISKDVFYALFGIKHDPRYLSVVVDKILEAKFVREDYVVEYKIKSVVSGMTPEAPRRIIMSLRIRYKVRNLSSESQNFNLKYGIPVVTGSLSSISRLTYASIGSEEISGDLESLLAAPKHGSPAEHLDQKIYEIQVPLDAAPFGEKTISLDAELVKEISDSETFGFLHPTMGMTLKFSSDAEGFEFGARARAPGKIVRTYTPADGRSADWKIDGPILPHNSVVLWWRPRADPLVEGRQAFPDPPTDTAGAAQIA